MLDFNFDNLLGFFLAFIPALINIAIVSYILLRFPHHRLTAIFTLLVCAVSGWQLNDALSRIVTTPEAAAKYDILFSFCWILLGPLSLHFTLEFTGRLRIARSFKGLVSLYLPALLFISLYQGRFYPHEFNRMNLWGWVNYHNTSAIDLLMVGWITFLVVLSLVLMVRYALRFRRDRILGSQTVILAIGMGIPVIAGIIFQGIYPILLNIPAVPLTSLFMSAFSFAAVISLNKFNLFRLTDIIPNEKLIESMPLAVFSVSEQCRIFYMNRHAREIIGLSKGRVFYIPLKTIHSRLSIGHAEALDYAWSVAMKNKTVSNLRITFNTDHGRQEFEFSCSPLENNNTVRGVLFVGRNITELNRSYEEMREKEMLLNEAQQIARLGSWEWQINTGRISWSEELYRIFDYEPDEIELTYDDMVNRIHSDDKPEFEKAVSEAILNRGSFHHLCRAYNKNSLQKTVRFRGSISYDAEGRLKMTGTVQDLSRQS